jgi:hypothetical protein
LLPAASSPAASPQLAKRSIHTPPRARPYSQLPFVPIAFQKPFIRTQTFSPGIFSLIFTEMARTSFNQLSSS